MSIRPTAAHILDSETVSRTLDGLATSRAIERIWTRNHALAIQPFDQPHVQESKDNTGRVLKETGTKGTSGQLHKGGTNSGLFVEFVDTMRPDLPVPGKFSTFGMLAQAQAIGDLQSLHRHKRPAAHIALGRNPAGTIRSLLTLLAPARTGRRKAAMKKWTTPKRRAHR